MYALGYGEGVNQLTIKSVNGGLPYVEDALSIEKYGLCSTMLDILDLAYMNVTHEKLAPNVLKEWVGYITDEISQISKIKQSDKNR